MGFGLEMKLIDYLLEFPENCKPEEKPEALLGSVGGKLKESIFLGL